MKRIFIVRGCLETVESSLLDREEIKSLIPQRKLFLEPLEIFNPLYALVCADPTNPSFIYNLQKAVVLWHEQVYREISNDDSNGSIYFLQHSKYFSTSLFDPENDKIMSMRDYQNIKEHQRMNAAIMSRAKIVYNFSLYYTIFSVLLKFANKIFK